MPYPTLDVWVIELKLQTAKPEVRLRGFSGAYSATNFFHQFGYIQRSANLIDDPLLTLIQENDVSYSKVLTTSGETLGAWYYDGAKRRVFCSMQRLSVSVAG